MYPSPRRTSASLVAALLACASVPALAQTTPPAPAVPPVVSGEVLIVPGDAETLIPDGAGFRVRALAPVTKKVIATLGDHFHTITIWLTFPDGGNLAGAYSTSVKNDVRGLGLRLKDMSMGYGSAGVLRTVITMKDWGLRAGDTLESWNRTRTLSVWGQEYAHRWAMFMLVRDPRTNQPSELLLGRDCSHYSRYVETQGSVMDGYSWTDNGDGSFLQGERATGLSNLDLYTMGLLDADEVPPFFAIDEITGFTHPGCGAEYARAPFPQGTSVRGKRINLSIDDLLFANGPRVPASTTPEDSFREAIVVLTRVGEAPTDPVPTVLAARLNRGRPWWDDWLRAATKARLHNCTRLTAPCVDRRADVESVRAMEEWRPGLTMLPVEVTVVNSGTGDLSTGRVKLERRIGAQKLESPEVAFGQVAPGARQAVTVNLPTSGLACGTEVIVRAHSQTEAHHSVGTLPLVLGVDTRAGEDFEADTGWVVNPDGDDSAPAGAWERGKPQRAELRSRVVQLAAAHGGEAAFVTGLRGSMGEAEDVALVSRGRTTLESPPLTVGLPAPRLLQLRYWLSFAGGRPGVSSVRFDPSDATHLTVLARPLDTAGAPAGDYVMVDRVSALVTREWIPRLVPLTGPLQTAPQVQLRFVAADEDPAGGAVEAAIDDVALLATRADCVRVAGVGPDGGVGSDCPGPNCPPDDDAGCACSAPGRPARGLPAPMLVIVLLSVAGVIRLRRATTRESATESQPPR
jgi:hypothetical protein